MPITSLDDVREQLPQVEITQFSRPDEASVGDWIEEAEAILFATIANVTPKTINGGSEACGPTYVTPFDPAVSPLSARIVTDMVVHAVAARVLRARLFGVGDVTGSGALDAERYYNDRVKWLTDPAHPFTFPDALTTEATGDCGRAWFSKVRGNMGGGYVPMPTMRRPF